MNEMNKYIFTQIKWNNPLRSLISAEPNILPVWSNISQDKILFCLAFINLWWFLFRIRSRQVMSAWTIEQCLPTLIIHYSNLKECFPQAVVTEKLHLRVWECAFEVYVSVCITVNSFYQKVLTHSQPGVYRTVCALG